MGISRQERTVSSATAPTPVTLPTRARSEYSPFFRKTWLPTKLERSYRTKQPFSTRQELQRLKCRWMSEQSLLHS